MLHCFEIKIVHRVSVKKFMYEQRKSESGFYEKVIVQCLERRFGFGYQVEYILKALQTKLCFYYVPDLISCFKRLNSTIQFC
jgi:hypothetical protein